MHLIRPHIWGTAGIRRPIGDISDLGYVLESDDAITALRSLLRREEKYVAAIAVASPSLLAALDVWLKGHEDNKVAEAVYRYVSRCCARPTPFGLCAEFGVIACDSGVATTSIVQSDAPRRFRGRADRGAINFIGTQSEADDDVFMDLRVQTSGLVLERNGRLCVYDLARLMEKGGSPVPTSVAKGTLLDSVLARATKPIRAGDVILEIERERNTTPKAALAFVRELVKLGLLITEFRLPLTADPVDGLTDILQRTRNVAALGVPPKDDHHLDRAGQSLLTAINEINSAANVAVVIDVSRSVSNAFREAGYQGDVLQIDSYRNANGVVGNDVTDPLCQVFSRLITVSVPQRKNRAIANWIQSRYNSGRAVSLLEALEVFDPQLIAPPIDVEREVRLAAVAAEGIGTGAHYVDLDMLVGSQDESHVADSDIGYSYDGLVSCSVRAGKLHADLYKGFTWGGGRLAARFGDFSSSEYNFGNPERGRIGVAAEFSFLPHLERGGNVVTRRNEFRYEVLAGVFGNAETEALKLDDIYIVEQNGQALFWSKKLDSPIRLHQSHMLNRAGSLIASFVAAVEAPPLESISFSWGTVGERLPFVPGVKIAPLGAIVALPRWNVPVDVAKDIRSDQFREWSRRWKAPTRFFYCENDNRLLIDLNHAVCRAQVERMARALPRGSFLRFEPLPGGEADPGNDKLADQLELHVALIPRLAQENSPDAERLRVGDAVQLWPPALHSKSLGSEWIYVRVYIVRERGKQFLAELFIPGFSDVLSSAEEFHYIFYEDPDEHIRIRIKIVDPIYRKYAIAAVLDRMAKLVESGILDRVDYGTYNREIERYGGHATIGAAERIFSIDSKLVISQYAYALRCDSYQQYIIESVYCFVVALYGHADVARLELRGWLKRRSVLPRALWDGIRRLRSIVLSTPTGDWALIATEAQKIRESVAYGRDDKVFKALTHMHCNRLGLSRQDEESVMHQVAALLDMVVLGREKPSNGAPNV